MRIAPAEAHVLVVEDDPDNLMVTLDLLAVAGVTHVEWVTDGQHVREAAQRLGRVDLVLLDIALPDVDGRTLVPELHTLPECAKAHIVAVTARVMAEQVAEAEAAGFDGFIGKPLDYDRFPGQIRALLNDERVWSAR